MLALEEGEGLARVEAREQDEGRARSEAGVSPVRTTARMPASGSPIARSSALMPVSGASRLRLMSFDSALSGDT